MFNQDGAVERASGQLKASRSETQACEFGKFEVFELKALYIPAIMLLYCKRLKIQRHTNMAVHQGFYSRNPKSWIATGLDLDGLDVFCMLSRSIKRKASLERAAALRKDCRRWVDQLLASY